MMKVVFVISGLGVGGAEVQVCALADKLVENNQHVKLISLSNECLVKPKNSDIDIDIIDFKGGYSSLLSNFHKLVDIINSYKPDVVHSHMYHANIITRFVKPFLRKAPLICTAHSKSEGGWFRMLMYRLTDSLCSVTTNVSQEALNNYIDNKAVDSKKALVVYNGVDTNKYVYSNEMRNANRRLLSLSNEHTCIMSVGRLCDEKDYPNSLYALEELVKIFPNIVYVIIGEGGARNELELLSDSLGLSDNVKFLGRKDNVQDWLSASDIFLLPSKLEGFGLVVAEAMLCQRVVVATDCGGVDEVLGGNGYLVKPENPIALRNALKEGVELSNGKKNQLGFKARQHILANFDLNNITNIWISIYKNINGNKS